MEVTTVSPSPASPTEGDDLCEIDVTDVAIHSVTLLICLCGLAGNGAVLWLLGSHCSSRNRTTRYILNLTVFDFLFLLFLVPSTVLFLLEDVSCSIIMPLQYVVLLFWMPLVSYSAWLYTLMIISIKRCRSMHCPLWHCCHHPQCLLWAVCALLGAFVITAITVITMAVSLCMIQRSEYCWVSFIPMYAFSLIICAPFVLISSTIPFIKVKSGSHQQQPKRLDIVICLIVLFTLPGILWNLLQHIGYTIVSSHFFFLLTCIYNSIKPFIYFLVGSWKRDCSMGSCRRLSSMQSLRKAIHRVFEEPKENTARSNDPTMDTMIVSLLIPSTALLRDPRTVAERFLECPDQ